MRSGASNVLTKVYRRARLAQLENAAAKEQRRLALRANQIKFLKMRRAAKIAAKNAASSAVQRVKKTQNFKPRTIVRLVNGTLYEYKYGTEVQSVPTWTEKDGFSRILKIKDKYTRTTARMTEGGFTLKINKRRARFSIKKIRRGAPQKQRVVLDSRAATLYLESGNKMNEVVIPLSSNRFEAPLPEVEKDEGIVYRSKLNKAPLAVRRAKQVAREGARWEAFRQALIRVEKQVARRPKQDRAVRSPILEQALKAKILALRIQRWRRDYIPSLKMKEMLGVHYNVNLSKLGPNQDPKLVFKHQMFSRLGNFVGNRVGDVLTGGVSGIMENVYAKMKEFIPKGLTESKCQTVLIFFINIIHDIRDSQFFSRIGNNVIGILSTLEVIKGVPFLLATAINNFFVYAMQKLSGKSGSETVPKVRHQMLDEMAGPIASITVCIAAFFNCKLNPNDKVPNFFSLKGMKDFTQTSNSAAIFVKNHIESLASCFEWFHAKVNHYLFEQIIVDHPDELKEFLREGSILAGDPTMYQQICDDVRMQHRVFRLGIQASKLSAALAEGVKTSTLSTTTRQMITKINALQERLLNDCICPNVGYEPFVLQLSGAPGVGKSTLAMQLVPLLLKAINYRPVNEMVFVRSIGVDFWNGVCNQPFILYDDMFIEENSAPVQLAEWMQLKSSVPFNPNCAHLEDKKRRISPIGLIINSNKAYYGSELSFMYDVDAINRRRDALIHVDLDFNMLTTSELVEANSRGGSDAVKREILMRRMTEDRVKNGKSSMEYYIFYQALNVRHQLSQSSFLANFGAPMKWVEFAGVMCKKFIAYRKQELIAYEERFKNLSMLDDHHALLSGEKIDALVSEKINDYIKLVEKSDVNSFTNVMRRLADSGRSAIYGRPLVDGLEFTATPQERVDIISKAIQDCLDKSNDIAISSLTPAEKATKIAVIQKDKDDLDKLLDKERDAIRARHQMADVTDNALTSDVSIEQSSTVVTIDQGPVDVVTEQSTNISSALVPVEQDETFTHMAGHKYLLKTYEWKSTQVFNDTICDLRLPGDFFTIGEFSNSINSSIFRGYRYYKFDIELEVVVNASRMEFGTLLAAWQYSPSREALKYGEYDYAGQLVQGPHSFLHASNNSVAKFVIPYKFIFPLIAMRPGFELDSYCSFFLKVFNKLRCYDSASTSVNVSIFFSFKNLQKSGLYYNLGIKHQMLEQILLGALRGGAEALMRNLFPDRNRDKPLNPLPPTQVKVVNASGWCHGKNIAEQVHSMRLDALAQTPHFDQGDEMQIGTISRVFGFHGTFTWKTSQSTSDLLFEALVHPMYGLKHPASVISPVDVTNNLLGTVRNTPLSVVSSIYSYWRGSLEYRFDFINPFMMTGRIFVCFIPSGQMTPKEIAYYNYERCKSFYGVYFDLGEERSFTFVVPYISNSPVLEINTMDGVLGYIKLFTVNKLRAGSLIAEIDVNVFIRAGQDFELCVPSLPSLAPSFDRNYASSVIEAQISECKLRSFVHFKYNYWYGFAAGGVFTPEQKTCQIFKMTKEHFVIVSMRDGSLKMHFPVNYIISCRSLKSGFIDSFLPLCITRQSELMAVRLLREEMDKDKEDFVSVLNKHEQTASYFVWTNTGEVITDPFPQSDLFLVDAVIKHQADDRVDQHIEGSLNIRTMEISSRLFNESFGDLKDLMRRYQFYGDYTFKVTQLKPIGSTLCRIPILPSAIQPIIKDGIFSTDRELSVYNLQRSGLIPLIGSGFRFFRGSLRMKIVFPVKDITFLVSFVHDMGSEYDFSSPLNREYFDFNTQGYALYGQTTRHNNIVELEIPYYQRYCYLWANKSSTEPTPAHTLGYLNISNVSESVAFTASVQVFYALADDSRYSSFQGFPSTIMLSSIPLPKPLKMNKARQSKRDKVMEQSIYVDAESDIKPKDTSEILHQMEITEDTEITSVINCYPDIFGAVGPSVVPGPELDAYKDLCAHSEFAIAPYNFVYTPFVEPTCKDNHVHHDAFFAPANCEHGARYLYSLKKCTLTHGCYMQHCEDNLRKYLRMTFKGLTNINCHQIYHDWFPLLLSEYPDMFIECVCDKKTGFDQAVEESKKESESIISKIKEKCKQWAQIGWLREVVKWLGIGILIIGSALAFTWVRSGSTTEEMTCEISNQSNGYQDTNVKVRHRRTKTSLRKPFGSRAENWTHQMSTGLDSFLAVLRKNMYLMLLKIDGKVVGKCKSVAIGGRAFLGMKHCFDKAKKAAANKMKVEIELSKSNLKYIIPLADISIDESSDSSIVIFIVPKNVPMQRDIRQHFATDRDHDYIPTNCMVYDYTGEDFHRQNVAIAVQDEFSIPGYNDYADVTIPFSYRYKYGYEGACGSVLISMDGIPKIFGIHIAGGECRESGNFGISEPITRESLEEIQHQMLSFEECLVVDEFMEDKPSVDIPSNVEVLGTVDKAWSVYGAPKSAIVPTEVQNEVFPTTVCPAPLVRVAAGDPMSLALAKYSKIPSGFDQKTLNICAGDLEDLLTVYVKPVIAGRKQTLSSQEIFGGVAGFEEFTAMNIQSSEGFPLCFEKDSKDYDLFRSPGKEMSGKGWLFDFETTSSGRQLKRIHPKLQNLLRVNEEQRREGEIPLTVFITTLKDQTLPVEKVKQGKNRIFSNAPVQNSWATKKYFGVWQAAYRAAMFNNESAIGINVNSFQWTELFNKLVQKGTNVIVGDYSAFGDTLARDIMWLVYTIIEKWYKLHYGNTRDYLHCQQQRFMLFNEMCEGVHLARNLLFKKSAGIPSGFALTIEIDDLVNKLYVRYMFIKITNRPLSDFRRFCCLVTYGDDMILSINDKLKDEISFSKMQSEYAKYNISFTPASKDSESYEHISIYAATFLKAHFVPHPSRKRMYLSKLPLESCLERLNWKRKNISTDVHMYQCFRDSLRALHAHGPDVFNFYRQKMVLCVSNNLGRVFPVDGKPDLPTWDQLDCEMYGDL